MVSATDPSAIDVVALDLAAGGAVPASLCRE
jgi:hypothetical protein